MLLACLSNTGQWRVTVLCYSNKYPLPLWLTYPYGTIQFGRGQCSPPELV